MERFPHRSILSWTFLYPTANNICLFLFSAIDLGQYFLAWTDPWTCKCHKCTVLWGRKWVRFVWSGSACGVWNRELVSLCNWLHAFDLAHPHRKIRLNKSRAPRSQKKHQMCYKAEKIQSPILPSAGLHISVTPTGLETDLNGLKTISEMDWPRKVPLESSADKKGICTTPVHRGESTSSPGEGQASGTAPVQQLSLILKSDPDLKEPFRCICNRKVLIWMDKVTEEERNQQCHCMWYLY